MVSYHPSGEVEVPRISDDIYTYALQNNPKATSSDVLEKLAEYIPFEDAIFNHPLGDKILFVAYPSNRGGYAIKTVSKNSGDRTSRKLFPEEWAGLQGKELESVSGIPGLNFCHTGRFIVNCSSVEAMEKVLDYD